MDIKVAAASVIELILTNMLDHLGLEPANKILTLG
jgi:hypothetical protein